MDQFRRGGAGYGFQPLVFSRPFFGISIQVLAVARSSPAQKPIRTKPIILIELAHSRGVHYEEGDCSVVLF